MLQTLLSLLMLFSLPVAAPFMPARSFDASVLLATSAVPIKKPHAVEPVIKAKAALLIDVDSGTVLYEKNSRSPMPIASLTKIMTAVIILESRSGDEVVTIKNNYSDIDGVRLWFKENEQVTIKDLLTGLLVRSANDAAMILAEAHSGSAEMFVAEMNKKAGQLRLNNTHFQNPVGFDDTSHYASAYDLAILTKYALRNATFREIVKQPKAELTDVDGEEKRKFESTNSLLNSYLEVEGVKTGTTDAAGQCIINLARHPQNDHEVIAVLLNSPDRFQESKAMIDWGFSNYTW